MPQNLTKTINNLPVHVGVAQLKEICFVTILPLFLQWSENAELSLDDIHLRDTKWAGIVPIPGLLDVNAIAKQFFPLQGKGEHKTL